jgi:hypothetical protein
MVLAIFVGKSQGFLNRKGYHRVRRILAALLGAFGLFLFKDALRFWGIV